MTSGRHRGWSGQLLAMPEESSMRIEVSHGAAMLSITVPVFVGTTGKGEPGSANFPFDGAPLQNFLFGPEKEDIGTLVFDDADRTRRNVLSPIFFQYWWNDGKLVVREGFNSGLYKKSLNHSPTSGFSYTYSEDSESGRMYYTGNAENYICTKIRVELLDLLRFIEGKIDEEELKARAIK
jgi:hypothetical protein